MSAPIISTYPFASAHLQATTLPDLTQLSFDDGTTEDSQLLSFVDMVLSVGPLRMELLRQGVLFAVCKGYVRGV